MLLPDEAAAAALMERAVDDLEFAVRRDPAHVQCRDQLFKALRQLTRIKWVRAAGQPSEEYARTARRLRVVELEEARRRAAIARTGDRDALAATAELLAAARLLLSDDGVGGIEPGAGELREAEQLLQEASARLEPLAAAREAAPALRRAELLSCLAGVRERLGDPEAARALHADAVAIAEAFAGEHPEGGRAALWQATYPLAEMLARRRDHRPLARLVEAIVERAPDPCTAWMLAGEYFVRCLQGAAADPELDDAARNRLREAYAQRSVAAYRTAVAHGLTNLDFLAQPAFDPLRERADFKELLQSVSRR
jgi:hypothetical protein